MAILIRDAINWCASEIHHIASNTMLAITAPGNARNRNDLFGGVDILALVDLDIHYMWRVRSYFTICWMKQLFSD